MTEKTVKPTPSFNIAARTIHEVDPDRLEYGKWSDKEQQYVGEGDIYTSYSGDSIAILGTVRKPFVFQDEQWICTSNTGSYHIGKEESPKVISGGGAAGYRLVPIECFEGTAVSFDEKIDDCEAARNDPNGFFHGVTVKRGGERYVLCGPPVQFVPGPPKQLGLFEALAPQADL